MKREKNIINFYCKRCKSDFNCDVGKVEFPIEQDMPIYEKGVRCNGCNVVYVSNRGEFTDNFELTETGQSQLTELLFNSVEFKDD